MLSVLRVVGKRGLTTRKISVNNPVNVSLVTLIITPVTILYLNQKILSARRFIGTFIINRSLTINQPTLKLIKSNNLENLIYCSCMVVNPIIITDSAFFT